MGQLKSLERRQQKNETLKKRCEETICTVVNAGYVRKVDQAELNETKDNLQWNLPHHPVINPHKPENVRSVCNAAARNQGVALNDKSLSGPDLLQSLIGISFCFREQQIDLSADIEAMFLQVAVPNDDSRCLPFLWRDNSEQKMEVYEYTRHVLGQKAHRIVQITLCTKWRKIMQSITKVLSERLGEFSLWMTSSSQSEHPRSN